MPPPHGRYAGCVRVVARRFRSRQALYAVDVLFTPENHEPLTDSEWDEDRVLGRVREIVAATNAEFDPDRLWPVEEQDAADTTLPQTNLYSGASGIDWALERLRPWAETRIDLAAAARCALEAWRERPDVPERDEPPIRTHASLFWGETG